MPDLVALALPPGEAFISHLLRAWDRGDAVLPLDPRWPQDMVRQVLEQFGASILITPAGEEETREGYPVAAGDALVMATSGTTGARKGVVLTHDALRAAATLTSEALAVGEGDRWLACLPFAHIGGLGVWLRSHFTGTPVEVLSHFDNAAVDAAASECSLVSLVPAVLDRVDVAGFRAILLGGGPMPADRPANSVATYGLTETGGGVVYEGRPLPGVELEIRDDEVFMRSPTMARRYRDGSPVADESGWLATGDRGRFDGELQIFGRIDDLISSGGETIAPEAVEERLRLHPGVAEVLVAGVPDEQWGQVVAAMVVPTDISAPPKMEALRQWVAETRPRYEAPRLVAFTESLAGDLMGKRSRAALAELLAAEVDRHSEPDR